MSSAAEASIASEEEPERVAEAAVAAAAAARPCALGAAGDSSAPGAPGPLAAHRPRTPRSTPWGAAGFLIADVSRCGQVIGMGVTCGLHRNQDDQATCKKTLNFGAENLSAADCTLRLKRWLLRGLEISPYGALCRDAHKAIDPRNDCIDGVSAENIDAEIDRLWAAWCGSYPDVTRQSVARGL